MEDINIGSDILVKLYDDYDITVDNDMFGGWYWYDPLGFQISPTFPEIELLEAWTISNLKQIRSKYEKLYESKT